MADHHGNALDPRFYEQLQRVHGHFDVIITSPWFRMLDLAIPVMYAHVRHALFVHVPHYYMGNMPTQRREWFAQLGGLVHVISNLPVGPLGRRCEWLCLFTNMRSRRTILRLLPEERPLSYTI
jgi:hypothetical protein